MARLDNQVAIIGGRNIGDHYFGLSDTYNFHDTDLLGIGPIGAEANAMFDHFWNSEWVATADALTTAPDRAIAKQQRSTLQQRINGATQLQRFSIAPEDWSDDLAALERIVRRVVDEPTRNVVEGKSGSCRARIRAGEAPYPS